MFVLTYLLTRTLIHPLEDGRRNQARIATGDLDATVNVTSRDGSATSPSRSTTCWAV